VCVEGGGGEKGGGGLRHAQDSCVEHTFAFEGRGCRCKVCHVSI
jgi:hypothetical protein